MAATPVSAFLDWYCGEKFTIFDDTHGGLHHCFLQIAVLGGTDYLIFLTSMMYFLVNLKWYRNFNGAKLDEQTSISQVVILIKSVCLLLISFSWVFFRIGPNTVSGYPLRDTVTDFVRVFSWFMLTTVTYLEYSRSRSHHPIIRFNFLLGAGIYSYYFVVNYNYYIAGGNTVLSPDESRKHPTPINESLVGFHDVSFWGHVVTLSCHAFLAITAIIGVIPAIRPYLEANEEFSTVYNRRDDDEDTPIGGAFLLLVKQCMKFEVAPFLLLGISISIARGYILQLIFDSFGRVYASTEKSHDPEALKSAVLELTGIFVAYAAAGGLSAIVWGTASEKLVNGEEGLRNSLFKMMMGQELAYHDEQGSGKILTRFSSDTELVKTAFQMHFPMMFEASSAIVAGLIFLFRTSWQISLYMMTILPLTHAVSYYQGEFFMLYEFQSNRWLSQVGERVQDVFSKLHTVLIYGKKNTELESFRDIVFEIYIIQRKKAFLRGLFLIFTEMLGNATSLLALFLAMSILAEGKAESYGDFVTYCLFSINIVKGIVMVLKMFPAVISMVGAMNAVLDMIRRTAQKPEKAPAHQTYNDFQIRSGAIEFKNVRFKYPIQRGGKDDEALRGISFKIKPNSKVAIVGGSGAGKSTVFQLLARFYDPTQGQVLIDGQDLSQCTTESIRKHLGMVSQAHDLFAASLLENILYGMVEGRDDFFGTDVAPAVVRQNIKGLVDELSQGIAPSSVVIDPVMAAVQKANATDFIDTPFALAKQLGEGGKGLSGGQKQRMTIARALFKGPQILLLDEVTSALDPISEKVIQEALDKLTSNRTVLIVAHRLHTIKNADLILVMNKGKLLASGTHDELMKNSKKYSRMVNASSVGGTGTIEMKSQKEDKISQRILDITTQAYLKMKADEPMFKKYKELLETFVPELAKQEVQEPSDFLTTSLSAFGSEAYKMKTIRRSSSSDEQTSTETEGPLSVTRPLLDIQNKIEVSDSDSE